MTKFYLAVLSIVFFSVLAPSQADAQRRNRTPEDSMQYIVDSQPDTVRHGFFSAGLFNSSFHVQFDGDVTYLFSQTAAVTGFHAAWVINHKLSFGVKYDIIASPVKINKFVNTIDTPHGNTINPSNMSAMLTVSYIFRSAKKISIEPGINIGWQRISFSDPKAGWLDSTEAKYTSYTANYLVVNPNISVIWNTTKYFRIGAEVGAKGVFGKDYLRVKSYRAGGLYAGLFLRFGTF